MLAPGPMGPASMLAPGPMGPASVLALALVPASVPVQVVPGWEELPEQKQEVLIILLTGWVFLQTEYWPAQLPSLYR